MSKLILLLIFLLSTSAHAICKNKINPSKVIMFVDTNLSAQEIETAEKGACFRGERLVVIPKDHKEEDKYREALKLADIELMKCLDRKKISCLLLDQKSQDIEKKLNKIRNRPPFDELMKNELEELKKSKASLVSFIISGHDGGGMFSGEKGDLPRQTIGMILKDYPEVNKVQSAFLLGCYTGIKYEIANWKSIFPNLHLAGGYDASAPTSDKPFGHQYLLDLLTSEKALLQQADQKKLQAKLFGSVGSLKKLNSAVFIKSKCTMIDNHGYYYGSHNMDAGLEQFDIADCESPKTKQALSSMLEKYNQYDSGELEPPSDTARGELRAMYNKARNSEHCLKEVSSPIPIGVNTVFNLLFFNGVKQSFASFYKSDLAKTEEILKVIKPEEILKNLEELIKKSEEANSKLKKESELLEKSPLLYSEEKQKIIKENNVKLNSLVEGPAMAGLLAKVPGLKEKLIAPEIQYFDPPTLTNQETSQIKAIYELKYQISLQELELIDLKYSPHKIQRLYSQKISNYQYLIDQNKNHSEKIKKDPSVIKNIWIPNATNLKNKSRKEILQNIHNIHGLLSIPGLPSKQEKALSWLSDVSSRHLERFTNNPFSWHELRNKVEAPFYIVPLRLDLNSRASNGSDASPLPFGGGYGTPGGGIVSGGFSGGMGNGW